MFLPLSVTVPILISTYSGFKMGGSLSSQIKLCTGRPFQRKKLKRRRPGRGAGDAANVDAGSGAGAHAHADADADEGGSDSSCGGVACLARSRRESGSMSAVALAAAAAAMKPPRLRASQRTLLKETWVLVEEHISEVRE